MWGRLFAIFILLIAAAPAEAGCIDPAALAHSTVGITRYFDDSDKNPRPGVLGIGGTGWFLSQTLMVTVGHVAAAMNLSDQAWKQLDIRSGEIAQSIPARLRQVAGSQAEKVAVIELQTGFPGVPGLRVRMERLVPEEPVASVAYPGNRLRVAGGRFVHYGDGDKLAGTALLEMYDGNDRLVLDNGASGAPVFDCEGRVVAVVSNLFTKAMQFLSRATKVSTPWGEPNVASVPIQVLEDFVRTTRVEGD
jgi:hypothetical protein